MSTLTKNTKDEKIINCSSKNEKNNNEKNAKKKKKPKKTEDYRGYQLVYQGNRLIEAKYDLTLQEKRLILFAMSKIKPEKFKVEPITFSCSELSELCGLTGESHYSELKKTTAKLMSRVFVVRNLDEQTYTQLNWVTRSRYHEKEGTVEIKFNDDLGDFLIDLKKNFTAIPLAQTLSLSSLYAIRMYELLKQYESIGKRTFSLDELRETLGLSKEKLINYKDFRIKVLEISQRELSLKTDISFYFEEIKKSRRVTSLLFSIHPNDPQKRRLEIEKKKIVKKVKAEITFEYERKELKDLGFSFPTIRKFFTNFPEQQVCHALQVTLDQMEKGTVKNPKALFQKALTEGWNLDTFVDHKMAS